MAIVKADVVFWYEINEGSGTSIADANGGASGTLNGTVSWTTTGPTGLSSNVTSIASGITQNRMTTGVSIPAQVAFGWSGWYLAASATTTNVAAGNNIGSRIARMGTDGSGVLSAKISRLGVGDDYTITAGNIMDNSWHWILFQADSSGNGELFVDNVSKGTGVSNNALNSNTVIIGNGGDSATLTDYTWAGKMSQNVWFNRPLTSGERSTMYASGAGITYANLFAATSNSQFFGLM